MAEYINIKGQNIEVVASDPANPTIGQIWYNSTSNTLKGGGFQAAGWSAGGNFPGSNEGMGSTGTQTATLSAGYFNAGDGVTSSFTYNGTSWSPAPSMGTAREQVTNNMAGTQTAAVIACGRNATAFGLQATEEYNGSTWSPSGNYPAPLRDANLFGIQTAAIAAGGNSANPSVATNVNNSYDGSTWTATGNNNTTARLGSVSFGIQTAGILVGGFINSPTPNTYYDNVEEYDGSTWTSGGAYPIATTSLRGGGTQTAGIAFGGSSPGIPQTTATNIYNGSTWTAGSNMTTARSSFGSAKSGSSALNLAFAGNTGPAATNTTEVYTDAAPTTVTITAS
jgi:large repetitive protein